MKIKKFLLDQIRNGSLSEAESSAMLRELLALEVGSSAQSASSTTSSQAPIAITGYSCKLPDAENPEAFWKVLRAGQSNIRTFPHSRLSDFARTKRSIYEEYASKIEALQSSKLLEGGFFERIDTFDARFFGLSPAEAKVMGPPERFFLETSWAALSHAGYTREDLAGSNTATYCAYTPDVPAEYRKILQDDEPQAALYNNPGAIGYHLAHWLDLRGATMIVETTCSSSLSAVHLALRALRSGECDRAIVTGVSMYLFPLFRDLTDRVGVTSPTGRCKPFDAEANGFVLGEGAVSFVLRRLDDAVAHHDAIHAVVRGSAINTNGRTSNLMAPSPERQTELIARAWKDAGLENVTPDYVETHGAGTKLGDPVELQAIGDALAPDLPSPCVIGAVKGNVGHLFDASGAVSLLKVVLSLKHHWIPGVAGLSEPSSLLPLQRGNLSLSTGAGKEWKNSRVRRAGVMSLGINGTNAHVLIESPPGNEGSRESSRPFEVCCLSALGLGALWRMIDALATSLEETDATLKDVCWTLARRRDTFPFRLSIVCTDIRDLISKLRRVSLLREYEILPEDLTDQGIFSARVEQRQRQEFVPLPAKGLLRAKYPGELVETLDTYLSATAPTWTSTLYAEASHTVGLPPYSFDQERVWPNHEVEDRAAADDLRFEWNWTHALEASTPTVLEGTWVVVGPKEESDVIATRLTENGASVVIGELGESTDARDTTKIRSDRPADYRRFAEEIARTTPNVKGVLFCGGLSPLSSTSESPGDVRRAQNYGAFGLFHLVRALEAARIPARYRLVILAENAHAVDENDEAISPRVTTFGFAKVFSQENPLVSYFGLDVEAGAPVDAIAKAVEYEVTHPTQEELILVRRGERWKRGLARRSDAASAGAKEVSASEVPLECIVIAGGLGFLGLRISAHLAAKAPRKIALLSRTKLPPRTEWAALLHSDGGDADTRDRIRRILQIESTGTEVLPLSVDVTDPVQVEGAFARIRKQFGKIDLIVAAMKDLAHQPVFSLTEERFEIGLMNRVLGCWLLAQEAKKGAHTRLLCLSSISAIIGTKAASECSAVNQFLDAYPQWSDGGTRVQSLNLPLILEDRRHFRGGTPIPPISVPEFLQVFDEALHGGRRLSIVARFDVEEVRRLGSFFRMPFGDALAREFGVLGYENGSRNRSTTTAISQSESLGGAAVDANVSSAPAFDDEARQRAVLDASVIDAAIRAMWLEVLGRNAAPTETFFDAGGTSLSSLKLVQLIRKQWPELPFDPPDLYAAPTIAEMSLFVARKLGLTSPVSPSLQSPKRADADLDALLSQVEAGEVSLDKAASLIRQ